MASAYSASRGPGIGCNDPVRGVESRLVNTSSSGKPVVIEVALNGSTPKERNPNAPRTPDEIAADGKVTLARIVPPTSQNQAQIERDLRDFVPSVLDDAETLATRSCENLVRSYDPCISCSTHFLRIAWDRGRDSVS